MKFEISSFSTLKNKNIFESCYFHNSPRFSFTRIILLLAAVAVVFFCLAIGQVPSKLPFALVNYESPLSNCSYKSGCSFGNLSCRHTSYIENDGTFALQLFDNEADAFEAVKDGKVWGYAAFDKNYTRALVDRMWNYMQATQFTRNQSTTQVRSDI